MQAIFIAALCGVTLAGRLENQYLPPNNAQNSGGSGNFLDAPGVEIARNAQPLTGGFNQQRNQQQRNQQGYNQQNVGANSYYRGGNAGNTGYSENAFGSFRSQSAEAGATILRYDNENNGDGTYRYE